MWSTQPESRVTSISLSTHELALTSTSPLEDAQVLEELQLLLAQKTLGRHPALEALEVERCVRSCFGLNVECDTSSSRVKRPVRVPGGIDSRTSFLGNPTTGERGPHRVGTGELGIDPGVDSSSLSTRP